MSQYTYQVIDPIDNEAYLAQISLLDHNLAPMPAVIVLPQQAIAKGKARLLDLKGLQKSKPSRKKGKRK